MTKRPNLHAKKHAGQPDLTSLRFLLVGCLVVGAVYVWWLV